jgi:hypothetical protein
MCLIIRNIEKHRPHQVIEYVVSPCEEKHRPHLYVDSLCELKGEGSKEMVKIRFLNIITE